MSESVSGCPSLPDGLLRRALSEINLEPEMRDGDFRIKQIEAVEKALSKVGFLLPSHFVGAVFRMAFLNGIRDLSSDGFQGFIEFHFFHSGLLDLFQNSNVQKFINHKVGRSIIHFILFRLKNSVAFRSVLDFARDPLLLRALDDQRIQNLVCYYIRQNDSKFLMNLLDSFYIGSY